MSISWSDIINCIYFSFKPYRNLAANATMLTWIFILTTWPKLSVFLLSTLGCTYWDLRYLLLISSGRYLCYVDRALIYGASGTSMTGWVFWWSSYLRWSFSCPSSVISSCWLSTSGWLMIQACHPVHQAFLLVSYWFNCAPLHYNVSLFHTSEWLDS